MQVGKVLLARFGGRAVNVVHAAHGSATELVRLIVAHFPGFHDHSVYKGHQVFFYKRAQIFASDVYGAFQGKGLGAFRDIHDLTTFADYRVPAVLHNLEVLRYSTALDTHVRLAVCSQQYITYVCSTCCEQSQEVAVHSDLHGCWWQVAPRRALLLGHSCLDDTRATRMH